MRTVQMTIPRSVRGEGADGKYVKMVAPVETGFAELDAAVANYERLAAEHAAAFEAVEGARRALGDSIEADRLALADAHESGKGKKPSDAKVHEARGKLDAQEREQEALAIAVRNAARRVSDLLDENRAQWLEEARGKLDTERAGYADTVGALIAARESWRKASAMVAWLEAGGAFNLALHAPQWPATEHELKVEAGLEMPAPRTIPEIRERNRRDKQPVIVDGAVVVAPTGDVA